MTDVNQDSYTFFVQYRDGENDFQGTFRVYPDGTADRLDNQGNVKPSTDPYGKPKSGPYIRRRDDERWVLSDSDWPVGVGLKDFLEAAYRQLQIPKRTLGPRSVTILHDHIPYTVFKNQIAQTPQPDGTKLRLSRYNGGKWLIHSGRIPVQPDLCAALENAWHGIP